MARYGIKNQKGGFLIELLVVIFLLTYLLQGLLMSNIQLLNTRARFEKMETARQIAANTIEEFSALNPESLTDRSDFSDTVTINGKNYIRKVDVTVHPDSTRTIDVFVAGENTKLGGEAELSTTLYIWGQK